MDKENVGDDQAKLQKLLERFKTAMLVTQGTAQSGPFHTRPMAIAKLESGGSLWFITDRGSPKVGEIKDRSLVQLVLQDEGAFVAVTGVATVSKDRAKLDELWSPAFKAWFPDGKDDPRIALVHVEGREAEFWDQTGAKGVKYVFEAVKAIATGTRPSTADQHGKTTFS